MGEVVSKVRKVSDGHICDATIAWNYLEVPAKIFRKGAKTGALPQNGLSYFNFLIF